MAEGPPESGPPQRPVPPPPGAPPTSAGASTGWKALVLGPHGSARRTSAIRGAMAALVVLVIGLPLAIAVPGNGSPAAAPSTAATATPAGTHCPRASVTGGEKPPAMQPATVTPDDTVFVFGPTLRAHGGRPAKSSHVEVWLNTDEPSKDGAPLGTGPVKMLASEKTAHGCAFATSFTAPKLPSGSYEVRVFAFTTSSVQGWKELGGRTLTVSRHVGEARKNDAAAFAADFLLARLLHTGGATKAMLSKTARFPEAGDPGSLFSASYRSAKIASAHATSKGTYHVDVRIATTEGTPIAQTLELASGKSVRGDDLSLVVTRVRTASPAASSST